MEAPDAEGKPRLWLAPFDRNRRPRQIPNVEGRNRSLAPAAKFSSATRKGLRVCLPCSPGRDGTAEGAGATGFHSDCVSRQTAGGFRRGLGFRATRPSAVQMLPLGGGSPVVIGGNTCPAVVERWRLSVDLRRTGSRWPDLHRSAAAGQDAARRYRREDFIPSRKSPVCLERAGSTPAGAPGPSRDVYAFERRTVQRNLYRIPIGESREVLIPLVLKNARTNPRPRRQGDTGARHNPGDFAPIRGNHEVVSRSTDGLGPGAIRIDRKGSGNVT